MQIGVALGRQVADGVPQAERALAVAVEPLDLRRRLQNGVQNVALRSAAGERLRERGQGEMVANIREVGSDGRKRRLGRPAQEVKHAEAEPADEGVGEPKPGTIAATGLSSASDTFQAKAAEPSAELPTPVTAIASTSSGATLSAAAAAAWGNFSPSARNLLTSPYSETNGGRCASTTRIAPSGL